MDEREQWPGDERREGGDRRSRFERWMADERRLEERRRGGIGTHRPDPTEQLLEGIHLPESLAFEPAAGTTGDQLAANGAFEFTDAAVSHMPFSSEASALARRLAPEHRAHGPIPSTAAIAGHPLHPVVVPLPIGALAGAFAADLGYAVTGDPFFARAARLLTFGGLATGAIAAVLGGIDFWTHGEVRSHRAAWFHAAGNAAALSLGGVSLGLRSRDEQKAVLPVGLALSAVSGVILLVTGWLGGELAYRHRVGLTDREARR
jgi:uncharacterized membrane protein